MKSRFLAAAVLGILMLDLTGFAIRDGKRQGIKRSEATQLAALLPASDGVVTLDVKRFFGAALPKLLTANPKVLGDILSKVDEIKSKTGIDVRQFDSLAVGIKATNISDKKYDFEPVVIARGQINSGALIGTAKLASKGKYREEKAGEKIIYIFAAKDIAEEAKKQVPAANTAAADKVAGKMSRDVAVTALDANTIVFGSLPLVRQTLERKSMIGSDLFDLLGRREPSVVSFAAKLPAGMKGFLPIENDELGKTIDAIRYLYGSMDVNGDITSVNMTARTVANAQAAALLETLEGLQTVGQALLSGSKGADKQVYVRMIENAKFSINGNEVNFALQVPQADVDILVGGLK